jgi:hypothetical protein
MVRFEDPCGFAGRARKTQAGERMKFLNVSMAALAPLLVGTLTEAQSGAAQQPNPQEAGAKVEPAPVLEFGVSGLTMENLQEIQSGLSKLTSQVFLCSGCKRESPKAGSCETCKLELEADKKPVLLEVAPSADKASIRVKPAPGRLLHYSDLERALQAQAIKIEGAKFPLPGKATLVLRGGTAQDVAELQKILGAAKLFEEIESRFDPATGEIRMSVRSGKTPPTMAAVSSTLLAAGVKATLADVIWGQPVLKG